MDSQLSFYAKSLDISARDQYERKLKYADSTDKLPDPYFMLDGWQNDPSMWPDLTFAVSGHVQEVMYMDIANTRFCLMKLKVTPFMGTRDKPHEQWVYLTKETAEIYCVHCTCISGGNRLTNTSTTHEECKWNANFCKQSEPMSLQEMTEKGLLGNCKLTHLDESPCHLLRF
ncbi:hypothetical protein LSH36_442g03002 [Paralvinella palmiformis]|uniref:Uncharacterized protein n=1 Tax=Paralvinella palmiformis TaxID=53620 RepID=A0AAD9JAL5_9ANNE|nr:hypothetical protein LSH36_442g03002 [Paralvinella palmiformis]